MPLRISCPATLDPWKHALAVVLSILDNYLLRSSRRREKANSYLADVEINKFSVFMRDVAPEVSTHEAVPPIHKDSELRR